MKGPVPVARVALITLPDDRKAKVIRAIDESAGGWIIRVPAGTLLYTAESAMLAKAVLAYDAAIRECANDPDKMASHCTATGEGLDKLYLRMVDLAAEVR